MGIFTTPTSYRLASLAQQFNQTQGVDSLFTTSFIDGNMMAQAGETLPPHASHPAFGHLILLVFEAVLEVVCVSLPGYIVARQGMFDQSAQKFVANLNVQLFTPCLVFTKLASQLNADKLIDLAIIPFIFIIQTLVSWLSATIMSKVFRFEKRQKNFVTAMGVFGNSNSLPISLVISLSKTISGLHWDQVPGDNDNEVAARGILYLLIFQQLGQLLRWSWGYNVLLKPPTDEEEQEGGENNEHDRIEEGRYRDDVEANENPKIKSSSSDYASGSDTHTPEAHSPLLSSSSSAHDRAMNGQVMATPTNGNIVGDGPGNMAGHMGPRNPSTGHITQFPSLNSPTSHDPDSLQGKAEHVQHAIIRWFHHTSTTISTFFSNLYRRFPVSLQKVLNTTFSYLGRFVNAIYQSMNPPLWAMLIAVVVASVPALQRLFFEKGTFINNSVTSAVAQSGGVAVPLILVVLGANLARNTIPQEDKASTPEEKKEERNLLYASLISRMLLPTIIMAPLLALCAKYIPVSILDDPIFVIVCFLLTGAPSALQLAQICQLHNVFMGVMSRLLFQSYVIWILPSTLVLVMLALEVVEWAAV